MLTMQQLEELEGKVIKALQLIGDLRTENAKLENDNEVLKSEVEEARLSLEEKEQEILRIKNELDATARELQDIKDKEDLLEKKIISLLGKLDMLQGGGGTPYVPAEESPAPAASANVEMPSFTEKKSAPAPQETLEKAEKPVAEDDIVILDDDISVETVEASKTSSKVSSEDDIIIIDDELDMGGDVTIEKADKSAKGSEDEIILLDDGDEIIIDDLGNETVIVDDHGKSDKKKKKIDDDDEFLILEEDDK